MKTKLKIYIDNNNLKSERDIDLKTGINEGGGHENEPGVSLNEVNVLGYDLIPPTTDVDGTFVWEISGLSHNNHQSISRYYGVSDTILKDF